MKPAAVELGQVWRQDTSSLGHRVYAVVDLGISREGYVEATMLDLERGTKRRVNADKMASHEWPSWQLFEP